MALRECELCEKGFKPKKVYQRFCSANCKKDWERGERLLIAKMKKWGLITRKSVKAALASAGAGEDKD